jgi:[ribosomal protein S5]-alanine N-acetyltransferase
VRLAAKNEFVSGSRIFLRPLEREDLNARYLEWLNDPEVTRYLETGVFPSTIQDLENFYSRVTSSSSDVILAVIDRKTNKHIGNVKLGPIDWVHRRSMFGIMIGDKGFWGKGVGEETTRLMMEYAFGRLNLHRVGLVVYEEHKAAVRCYQRVGFKIEGRLREQMFQDGQYKHHIWMGLLRSEFKPVKASRRK